MLAAFALRSRKGSSPHQYLSEAETLPPASPQPLGEPSSAVPGLRLPAAPARGGHGRRREGKGRPGRLGGPGGACVALPGRGSSARLSSARLSSARGCPARAGPRGAAPADAMPKPEVSASYQEVRGAGQGGGRGLGSGWVPWVEGKRGSGTHGSAFDLRTWLE